MVRRLLDRGRDPVTQVVLLLVGGTLAGFAGLVVAWRGAARTALVPLQLPWLASGAVAGVTLVGVSLAVLGTYEERRADALRQQQLDTVIAEMAHATARIGALAEARRTPQKAARTSTAKTARTTTTRKRSG